jgi:pyruvate/2-oxoacid:ferredoxin oxidoreductase beta subunit
VYVASISLGASYVQTMKALREAEAYPGPSLILAYVCHTCSTIGAGALHDGRLWHMLFCVWLQVLPLCGSWAY